tara:strand:- start:9133 stop:9972 length:840 start_codon:yes stop_codon:yes gene_type:complete
MLIQKIKRKLIFLSKRKQKDLSILKYIIEKGKILKEKRESLGITRVDLSIKTKISTSVIEAIENGWSERLPEKPYLAKMLLILEEELNLPKNTLIPISIKTQSSFIISNKKKSIFHISLFNNFFPNIIYLILMISSIYYLNYQNEKLAKENYYGITSLKIIEDEVSKSNVKQENKLYYSNTNEEIESLSDLFNYTLKKIIPPNSWGILELDIKEIKEITVIKRNNQKIIISNFNDKSKIIIELPAKIKINPQLLEDEKIIINDKLYKGSKNKKGIYTLL